jgi:GT2 family glycosyltransferase
MARVGLVVPTYKNFVGFAELMHSVDYPITPIVIPNWIVNLGVSKGWNAGIKRAIYQGQDFVLISNDDVVLGPGTIAKLVASMALGFDLVSVTARNSLDVRDDPGFGEAPDFSCFMIRPKLFTDKFGFFDEEFSPAYFEDNDMHYRMKLAGGMAVNRLDAVSMHKGSVTQNWNGQQVVTGDMFRLNESYYILKWGGGPGNEIYTKPFGEI